MSRAALCLLLSAALAACTEDSSSTAREPPATTSGAVTLGSLQPANVTFAQLVGELGVQVEAGVPEADAEALYRLMIDSGYQAKAIRMVAPEQYIINAWGSAPHAATEFTLRRDGNDWQVLRDESWILFGGDDAGGDV